MNFYTEISIKITMCSLYNNNLHNNKQTVVTGAFEKIYIAYCRYNKSPDDPYAIRSDIATSDMNESDLATSACITLYFKDDNSFLDSIRTSCIWRVFLTSVSISDARYKLGVKNTMNFPDMKHSLCYRKNGHEGNPCVELYNNGMVHLECSDDEYLDYMNLVIPTPLQTGAIVVSASESDEEERLGRAADVEIEQERTADLSESESDDFDVIEFTDVVNTYIENTDPTLTLTDVIEFTDNIYTLIENTYPTLTLRQAVLTTKLIKDRFAKKFAPNAPGPKCPSAVADALLLCNCCERHCNQRHAISNGKTIICDTGEFVKTIHSTEPCYCDCRQYGRFLCKEYHKEQKRKIL